VAIKSFSCCRSENLNPDFVFGETISNIPNAKAARLMRSKTIVIASKANEEL